MKQIIVLALILFKISAFAQINESDTLRHQLRSSLTGNYQKGNVNVLVIRSKIDYSIKLSSNFVFKTQNSSLYQEFSNRKADNDIFSKNYLYFKPKNKVYPFAIAYISTNYRRKIDIRYFTGIGLTYQLINSNNNVLKLSANAVYENTKFKSDTYNFDIYNGSNQIKLWRSTLYVGGWNYLINNKIRIFYDAFYQPAFNNTTNYRSQLDIGIDFPILKGFTFNALYTFTHENVAPVTIKQEDKILTFGFSYQLRKR